MKVESACEQLHEMLEGFQEWSEPSRNLQISESISSTRKGK